MAGSTWTVFAPATKAKSSEVNANFDWIEGDIVPMSAGSQTDAVYSLGTTTARWFKGYFSDAILVGSSLGSAYIHVAKDNTGASKILLDNLNSLTSSAEAIFHARTGGINTGDAKNIYEVNGVFSWHVGLDNSDGDKFKIAKGLLGSGGDALNIATDMSVSLFNGVGINEFSSDGTLAGDSDLAVPTEKAVKSYVDGRWAITSTSIVSNNNIDTLTATVVLSTTSNVLVMAKATVLGVGATAAGRSEIYTAMYITRDTGTTGGFNGNTSIISNSLPATGSVTASSFYDFHTHVVLAIDSPGAGSHTYQLRLVGTSISCSSYSLIVRNLP